MAGIWVASAMFAIVAVFTNNDAGFVGAGALFLFSLGYLYGAPNMTELEKFDS